MTFQAINETVYDGPDMGFYQFHLDIDCPKCGTHFKLPADQLKSLDDIDDDSYLDYLVDTFDLKRANGQVVHKTIQSLYCGYLRYNCFCGVESMVVASYGNVQNGRTVVYLHGIKFKNTHL